MESEQGLTPSRKATDYEFIRRVSLDIIGRIASPAEIEQFLKDPIATRRSLLVNRLLDSEEYAQNWADIWTVWLLTRSSQTKYHEELAVWLEDQFSKENKGWDKIVTALLTASGKNDENGAANFVLAHMGEMTPRRQASRRGVQRLSCRSPLGPPACSSACRPSVPSAMTTLSIPSGNKRTSGASTPSSAR